MSSSARRLQGADAQPFVWGSVPPVQPPPAPEPEAPTAEEAAPPAPAPVVSDEELRAAHQERLAAIEREAFARGYEAGERAGLEAGKTRAEAMLRRLAQTLDELRSLRTTLLRQTETQMVELALAIARKILRREASFDQDLLVAMARVALDRVGEQGSATIRLNPEDYAATAQRHGDQWAGSRVAVLADPSVPRGGCIVESEFGQVDASVEAQFDHVAQALLGEEEARDAA
ncbi:MAG TPA: FliH/SctL family protein [Vicinamibacterales bacterium]